MNKCQQVREVEAVEVVEEVVEAEEVAVWAEVDDGRAWGLQRSANVRVADTPSHTSPDSLVPM